MSILLIGLNHRSAPVEVREQLAFSREGVATALMLFRNQFPGCEAAILSTCNRVEVLVASPADAAPGRSPVTAADVLSFLAQARDLPVNNFRTYLYQLSDEQAVRHLFRVVSGLDSMVLGEYQIVSQMKEAYAAASEQGTTGRVLNRLFHQAFSVSKRIRTETGIGQGKVSVPSVAVDVARRIFNDFADKHTLVVGAGEMAQLVCQYLRQAQATRFTVTSRSLLNARTLAEACQGQAVPFDQLDAQLALADIVITATGCPRAILTVERIRAAQQERGQRPLFLIDLAVPRNVDPAVGELPQVFVYDIDELGRIAAANQQHRQQELTACERVLDEEITAFDQWLGQTRTQPLIEQMVQDARELAESELERFFRRCPDLSAEEREQARQLAERLVGKFMHPCVRTLREHGAGKGLEAPRPASVLAESFHALAQKMRKGA